MTTDQYITTGLSILWAITAAGLAWYVAFSVRQITYVTLADGRRQERILPILFRLLLPLTPNFTPLFRRSVFNKTRSKTAKRIVAAGFEGLLSSEEFLALRVLFPLFLAPVAIVCFHGAISTTTVQFLHKIKPIIDILILLLCIIYPAAWIRKALMARHSSIQRSLPFVLDLLTLSVEAGIDFMSALRRCIERREIDPLGEELIRVVREIQLGRTRRQALRDMSARVDLSDLRSVVNALVQADELGVSIGSILRIQADQMRRRRFERAEKKANEAPVKMLLPLMLFIFPSVFLILLGPILTRLIQQGF